MKIKKNYLRRGKAVKDDARQGKAEKIVKVR